MKLDISDSDITEVQLNDLLAGYEFDTIVISKIKASSQIRDLRKWGMSWNWDFIKVTLEK